MANPLISVVVITYNSSKTVLETLESIYHQSHKNIELIISDDASPDNTVSICKDWLEKKTSRFTNTDIITTKKNFGISANCNRGWNATSGKWVKLIAGDDILDASCIEKFMSYAASNPDIQILTSRFREFYVDTNGEKQFGREHPHNRYLKFFNLTAEKQYKWLLTNSFNIAPATIIKREVLDQLNGFDEAFPFFEDLPMWIKATKNSIKMSYISEIGVYYRIHDNSIRVADKGTFFNTMFRESLLRFKKEYAYPNIPFYQVFFWQSEWAKNLQYRIIVKYFNNQRSIGSKFVFRLFLFLNLSYMFNALSRRIR